MIKAKKYLKIKIEQPDGTTLVDRYFPISDYNTEVVRSATFIKELDWMVAQLKDSLRAQDLDFMISKNSKYDLRSNGFNKKWKKEIFQRIENRDINQK